MEHIVKVKDKQITPVCVLLDTIVLKALPHLIHLDSLL